MTTPIKDPFDDLLDMGSADQPPPPPTSQPPGGDSWMVLSKDEEDFKSIATEDLFGSGSSSQKAHGSTFDDLFGEGSSSNKAKSTPASHGSTFDDLFDEKSPKVESSHTSNFTDIFGKDIAKQPTGDSCGESSSKSSVKTEKIPTDDLFTDKGKSETIAPNWDVGIDELFGSGKSATKVEKTEDSLDDLFGFGTKETNENTTEKPGKSNEEVLDDIFGEAVVKNVKSRSRDTPVKKPVETAEESLIDIFGPPQTEKSPTTKAEPSLDIFGSPFGNDSNLKKDNKEEPVAMKPENISEDLFKSPPIIKSAQSEFDDLFGGNSSTPDHTEGADKKPEKNDGAISKFGKSDLDFFLDVEPTLTSSESKEKNDKAEEMFGEKVEGKVEIVVSPVEESPKTSVGGNADDIDFTVIEDTSLLDLHLSRHKTSLRKRGSLARRKKPSRSSMRPAEDIFASSSNGADIDGEKKKDEDDEAQPSPGNKEDDDKGDNRTPVKSPVAGGMMMIGPGALAQSQLMKGIMRKSRKDEDVTSTNQSSVSKTTTNEPSVLNADKEEKAKSKVAGSPKNKLFGGFKPDQKVLRDSKSNSSEDEARQLGKAMPSETQETKSRPTSTSKLDDDKSESVSTPTKSENVSTPSKSVSTPPKSVSSPPKSVSTTPKSESVSSPSKSESLSTPPKRVSTIPKSESDSSPLKSESISTSPKSESIHTKTESVSTTFTKAESVSTTFTKSESVSTPPTKSESVSTPPKSEIVSTPPTSERVSTTPKSESGNTPPKSESVSTPPKSESIKKQGTSNKPIIKTNKPQIQPRPAVSSESKMKETLFGETVLKPITPLHKPSKSNNDDEKRSPFSTALKPISPNVPEKTSTEKKSSVILEKVTLRSTRCSAGDSKVTSPTTENKAIIPDLAERKNSLRRVKKTEESAETKEVAKSEPSWLKEMKRRSWSRGSDEGGVSVPETRSPVVKASVSETVKLSESRPGKVNKSEESPRKPVLEKPSVLPDRPKLTKKPLIDRPKPKVDVVTSQNGRGESPSKPSNGVKETNVISDDTPSWKRELAERNKKKKPEGSTPPKSEASPEGTVNWRSQLSQKKRKPVVTATGDGKSNCADAKQPEWAIQAELRRARLAKSGILGQK